MVSLCSSAVGVSFQGLLSSQVGSRHLLVPGRSTRQETGAETSPRESLPLSDTALITAPSRCCRPSRVAANSWWTCLLGPACQAPNVGFAYVIAGIVGQNQATGLKDQSDLPGWEILRRGVCPYSTAQRMEIAYNQTWIITSTFLSGLIESFLPIFKQRWSMLQFGDFVQGFIQTC